MWPAATRQSSSRVLIPESRRVPSGQVLLATPIMEDVTEALLDLSLNAGCQGGTESSQLTYKSPCPSRFQLPNPIPPVYSLPPEITSLIFGFLQKMLSLGDSRKLPVKLSHVSQHWRNIAIWAAPFLWTNIDFSPPWNLGKISMYLERSGNYPFTLDCVWPTKFHADSPEVTAVFSLVAINLPRCRRFSTRGNLNSDLITITIVKLFLDRELPLLQTFSIERAGHSGAPINFIAPALTNLRLGMGCSLSLAFQFNSLTTLHFAIVMEYDQLVHILTSCPTLATLAVYDDLIRGWPDPEETSNGTIFDTPVTLHCLRSIQIYGNMRNVSELLLSISAPVLNNLVIAPIVANDLIALEGLYGKTPTFPSLTSLTLAPAHGYAFEVLPIAHKCFPGVEHLAFANIYSHPFERYFCDSDTALLWPDLKTIAFRGVGYAMELIKRMVSLRRDRGHPLHKLYLDDASFHIATDLQIVAERLDVWESFRREAFYEDDEDRFLGIDERYVEKRSIHIILADNFIFHPSSDDL